jgi:hypothetical protein
LVKQEKTRNKRVFAERTFIMKTRRMIYPVLLGLIVLFLPIALGACSGLLPVSSGSSLDVQSQVDTQVAATLVGYLVQTQVAANLVMVQATQAAVAQQAPTATPAPTETPLPPPPTPTPLPPTEPPPPPPPPTAAPTAAAAVASAPAPQISAQVNTNCRQGPSTQYKIDGYLLVGDTSYVYGTDYSNMWWYIQNPDKTSAYCWVWSDSTVVTGDASGVPVVATSEYAEKTSGYYNNWYTSEYYSYGDGYYQNGNWCTPVYLDGKVYCYPNVIYCDPDDYWNCNNQNNCCNWNNNWNNNCNNNCNKNCNNNCNKNCPNNSCGKKTNSCQVNASNNWSYCLKHPKCCGWTE